MRMNEFCRLAVRMDQQMQQLAAEGVSEAPAVLNRIAVPTLWPKLGDRVVPTTPKTNALAPDKISITGRP